MKGVHGKEKCHVCEVCGYATSLENLLKKHMESVHKDGKIRSTRNVVKDGNKHEDEVSDQKHGNEQEDGKEYDKKDGNKQKEVKKDGAKKEGTNRGN